MVEAKVKKTCKVVVWKVNKQKDITKGSIPLLQMTTTT
jgi:hypothetical protein